MEVLIEILKTLGTWVLVVVGWLVVSDQQKSRELGKNIYARLIAMRSDLIHIEDLAIKHHTTSYNESSVKILLRAAGDFSTEMSHLWRCGYVGLSTINDVTALRQAVTANNMDESTYRRQGVSSAIVDGIGEARAMLDRDLLTSSHKALSQTRTLRESVIYAFRKRL